MDKKAYLEEVYNSAIKDEIDKIAFKSQDKKGKRIAANIASLGIGLPVGAFAGALTGDAIGRVVGKVKAKNMNVSDLRRASNLKKIKGRATSKSAKGLMRNIISGKSGYSGAAKATIPGAILGAVVLKKLLNKYLDD